MAEEPMSFGELLAGYGTTSIGEGMHVESVFALLKVRADDGSAAWSVRSGGSPLAKEELLGGLDGRTTSMRERLGRSWRHESPATGTGAPPVPVSFSDLLGGLETVGLDDTYLIESVFAVIKARRADGTTALHARSSEMKLNPEERRGALEGYAAAVRQDRAETWRW